MNKPAPIPASEFAQRRECVRGDAAAAGLDGLLVWSIGGSRLDGFGDVFYLTNHYSTESRTQDVPTMMSGFGHAAVVLPADGEACLLVEKPDWRHDLVAIDDVRSDDDLYQLVIDVLGERGLTEGRVGIAREDFLPLTLYRAIRAAYPKLELVPANRMVELRRMVKSPGEMALMRHASAVSVEIMTAMLEQADVGRTDGDLAIAGFTTATRHGAAPWEFAMASGPHSEHMWWGRMPQFDPYRPYEAGDFVHPDVYGCVDGYFYDFVRSKVVGGDPSETQRGMMEAAIAIVHKVCGELQTGRRACDVYATGMQWAEEQGLLSRAETGFAIDPLPFFAHGIGLGWEGPWIAAHDDIELKEGMSVAVEIVVSGHGMGAAFEETVLLTDTGPEIMTAACPARWW
jgi:Xaa-Pro aminopeptidase